MLEKTENKRKEAESGPFFTKKNHQDCIVSAANVAFSIDSVGQRYVHMGNGYALHLLDFFVHLGICS